MLLLLAFLGQRALAQAPDGSTDNGPTAGFAGDGFFSIATGSIAGTYFPVGDVLAAVITHPRGSVRCEDPHACGPEGLVAVAQASEGSVRNVRLVARGLASSALAQADVVARAAAGEGAFAEDGPIDELRVIANLYPETLHLVAAVGSGIERAEDLAGKRVSIDLAGSGTYANARLVLGALGLAEEDLTLSFTNADENAERVLFGSLDAYFFMAGPPVKSIADMMRLGIVELIALEGEAITALAEATPALALGAIPAGTYPGMAEIMTLEVGALWIVHRNASEDLIYRITRALLHSANEPFLSAGHRQAAFIGPDRAPHGAPIALHPGAERYYREAGLLQGAAAGIDGAGPGITDETAERDEEAPPDPAPRESGPEEVLPGL